VHVLQGERPLARDNRTLGRFHLDGIPPAPRGVPQVEVTFDIDANGILNVSAKDKATSKQQNITITASSGLNKDEIEKMKREAESHAAEDARNRETIELKNQADSLVYSTERTLREHGDQVAAADKEAIESALNEAREALKTDDMDRIKRAQETLTQASHKLAEVMYREAQGKQPGAEGGAPNAGQSNAGGAKGDVVDAEFEDLGEKK
jgi:molecular chaperone DnaK